MGQTNIFGKPNSGSTEKYFRSTDIFDSRQIPNNDISGKLNLELIRK